MSKFQVSDCVKLRSYHGVVGPEQYGNVLETADDNNGLYLVCVYERYRQSDDPDGLVEVPEEQLELWEPEDDE